MVVLVDHIAVAAMVLTAVQPMSQVVVVPTQHQLQEVEVVEVQVLQMPTEIQEAVEEVALHMLHRQPGESMTGSAAVGVLDHPAVVVALLVALRLLAVTRITLLQAEVEVVEVLEAVEELVLARLAIMVITMEYLQGIPELVVLAALASLGQGTAAPMVVVVEVVVAIEKFVVGASLRVDRAEAVVVDPVRLEARLVLVLPTLAVLAQVVVVVVAPSILVVDPVAQELWSLP